MRPVWQVTTQRLPVQTWPPGQTVPHMPQLLLSVVRSRRLRQQQPLIEAQTKKTIAEAVNKAVEGFFSSTQAANQIAMNPAVAPMADAMLLSAGFKDSNAAPIIPSVHAGVDAAQGFPQNTSPLFPANPAVGINDGIEGGEIDQGAPQ